MKIIQTTNYNRNYKKLQKKKILKEIEILEKIKLLIINSDNLNELLLNPISKIYRIEHKSGNLKYYYTARLNSKLRLFLKPIGEYPYKKEEIIEIELSNIDDKHYGEG